MRRAVTKCSDATGPSPRCQASPKPTRRRHQPGVAQLGHLVSGEHLIQRMAEALCVELQGQTHQQVRVNLWGLRVVGATHRPTRLV
jgi:hypothetical protein